MIHKKYFELKKIQNKLLKRKNKIDSNFYNGIYNKYIYPILTKDHVPIKWRYDLSKNSNPNFIERLMVNSTFNSGAIYHQGYHYLVVRIEGADRKSFFALAKSKTGIDNFYFERLINWEDLNNEETNRYDMRLTKHEDGYIYGVFCSEIKDKNSIDTSKAIAKAGIVRTKDLINWERLPNLITKSNQQRNVVLHPEFLNNKYVFYTRPQDEFIEVGSGGGIYLGYVEDILKPIIDMEYLVHEKKYHTVYELKNGDGPPPIKTNKGWLHLAHGVRNTAAGLRYVLYMFITSLKDLTKVIASPSGYFMAPFNEERVGDVSNVLFSNGWTIKDNDVYIYYASSDTRLHVATTTIDKLLDYCFNSEIEVFNSKDATIQRQNLINKNIELMEDK